MRDTVPSASLAAQTYPPPARSALEALTDGSWSVIPIALGVDHSDRVLSSHPGSLAQQRLITNPNHRAASATAASAAPSFFAVARRGRRDLQERRQLLRHDLDHAHGLVETLDPDGTPVEKPDALELTSEVDDGLGCEDLPRAGKAAEPRGSVQGAAPVPALDGHGLARVEPDAYRQRKGRAVVRSLAESPLQLDGCS
jgi:hypothetical protein